MEDSNFRTSGGPMADGLWHSHTLQHVWLGIASETRHLQIIVNGTSQFTGMWFLSSVLVALLAFARFSFATSSSGNSVLVLLDTSLEKENYSIFFGGLESMC
jgi:hypothetical protein